MAAKTVERRVLPAVMIKTVNEHQKVKILNKVFRNIDYSSQSIFVVLTCRPFPDKTIVLTSNQTTSDTITLTPPKMAFIFY